MTESFQTRLRTRAREIDEIDNLMRVRRAANDFDSQTINVMLGAADYIEALEKRLEVIEDLLKQYSDKEV